MDNNTASDCKELGACLRTEVESPDNKTLVVKFLVFLTGGQCCSKTAPWGCGSYATVLITSSYVKGVIRFPMVERFQDFD